MKWIVLYDILDPKVLWGQLLVEFYAIAAGLGVYAFTRRLPRNTARGIFARKILLAFSACLVLAMPLQMIQTVELRRDFSAGRYATQTGIVTAVDLQHSGRHARTPNLLFRVGETWLQMPDGDKLGCQPELGDPARIVFSLRKRTIFSHEVNAAMRIELSEKHASRHAENRGVDLRHTVSSDRRSAETATWHLAGSRSFVYIPF